MGFATKPITGKKLLQAIHDCLSDAKQATTPAIPAAVAAAADDFDTSVLENLRDELGAEYVEAAVDIFLADLKTRLDAMKSPGLPRDILGGHGHALKSSAGIFGLTKLARAAEEIEQSVRKGEGSALDQQIGAFVAEASLAPDRLKLRA
jgi:HPt (histidine-containing phosphotransfer) domain-containing protein